MQQHHTEKDFILVLQTPSQAEMLCKCGHNKIICVDDTHGTNSYDFNLTTILVVDEKVKGILQLGAFLTEQI